jgi:hypothetical protein
MTTWRPMPADRATLAAGERLCAECGHELTPRQPTYCSPACHTAALIATRTMYPCARRGCDAWFHPSQSPVRLQRHCSRRCGALARAERHRRAYWDRAWLAAQLIDRQRTPADIAGEFHITANAVRFWIRRFGIVPSTTKRVAAPAAADHAEAAE